jgi:hypothetical protein
MTLFKTGGKKKTKITAFLKHFLRTDDSSCCSSRASILRNHGLYIIYAIYTEQSRDVVLSLKILYCHVHE